MTTATKSKPATADAKPPLTAKEKADLGAAIKRLKVLENARDSWRYDPLRSVQELVDTISNHDGADAEGLDTLCRDFVAVRATLSQEGQADLSRLRRPLKIAVVAAAAPVNEIIGAAAERLVEPLLAQAEALELEQRDRDSALGLEPTRCDAGAQLRKRAADTRSKFSAAASSPGALAAALKMLGAAELI